jgi:hypothetical protein
MRPGFSVIRKRPLGNRATAHGVSRLLAMDGDADVNRLVIRRVGLAGKDGVVGIELRRSLVDRLAFDSDNLEGPPDRRRVSSSGRLGQENRGKHRKGRGGAYRDQWLHDAIVVIVLRAFNPYTGYGEV